MVPDVVERALLTGEQMARGSSEELEEEAVRRDRACALPRWLVEAKASVQRQMVAHPRRAGGIAGLAGRLRLTRAERRIREASSRIGHVAVIPVPAQLRATSRRRLLLSTCDGLDQVARDFWLHGWASFELPLPDVFGASVQQSGGRIIDVGANTGFYSLLAAYASSAATIDAFEPFPPVLAALRDNIQLNRCRRVRTWPVAVSDTVGEAELYVPTSSWGLVETSCSLSPTFKADIGEVVRVSTTTLDEFTRTIGHVTVVKIDVEGCEHLVLHGALKLLAQHRPLVFFELLPFGDASAIDRIRATHDYVAVQLRPDHAILARSVAPDQAPWNQVLVPAERLAWFREKVLTQVGLSLTLTG